MLDGMLRDGFFLVDKRDELRTIEGYLRGDRDDVPIVTDEGRAFGVLNERGLLRSRIDRDEHLGHYVVGTKLVAPQASVEDAVDVCLTSGLQVLPVAEDDEVVGYVTAADLLLKLLEDGDGWSARDLAADTPRLQEDTTLGEAIDVLRDETQAVLPVVNERNDVVGVLERRAVLRAETKGDRMGGGTRNWNDKGELESRHELPVSGLMSSHYEHLSPDADVAAVRKAIREFGYAIVTEGRSPRGVLEPIHALRVVHRGPGASKA